MVKRIPVLQNIQKLGIKPMVGYLRMTGEKDHQYMMEMEIARILVCSHFYQIFCHLFSLFHTKVYEPDVQLVTCRLISYVVRLRFDYVIQKTILVQPLCL